MRRHHPALLRLQAQLIRRAQVHGGVGLVAAEHLGAEDVREGQLAEGREVVDQREVAVREGGGLDSERVQLVQAGGGVGPGREAVPDQAEVVDDVLGQEGREVVLVEEGLEGGEVVLVDGVVGDAGVGGEGAREG